MEGAASPHHGRLLQGAQLYGRPRPRGATPRQSGAGETAKGGSHKQGCIQSPLFAGERALAAQHLHLQLEDVQGGGSAVQARGTLD